MTMIVSQLGQRLPPVFLLLQLLVVPISSAVVGNGDGICFIQYLMADNNLESFIRADLQEWIGSPAIKSAADITNWVYFDYRNTKGIEPPGTGTSTPLANVWTSDGSALMQDVNNQGSYYMTYDHDLQKMVIKQVLQGEQNGDSPEVLQAYLIEALKDCVSKSRTEIFVQFGSHGGGFHGFGGDENKKKKRHKHSRHSRQLLQTNPSIVQAMQNAWNEVDGLPDNNEKPYTVIGFDACLMQALGALDDFLNLTQYFLASEALEPGHGWDYTNLQPTSSSLDLATQIVDQYVSSTQGRATHQAPKLLSVVDTDKYRVFLQAWEELSQDFLALMGQDTNFETALHRARDQSVVFDSASDRPGEKRPSALDIGSFLENFQKLCDPQEQLRIALSRTLTTYNDMFVTRKVGEGTPPGTGMHVIWPNRQTYAEGQKRFDGQLFRKNKNKARIVGAPTYNEFLQVYLNPGGATATTDLDNSVCGQTMRSALEDEETRLLLNPTIEITDTEVIARSDLKLEADAAIVEYGIDLLPVLDTSTFWDRLRQRRNRQRKLQQQQKERDGVHRSSSHHREHMKRRLASRRRHRQRHRQQRQRNLQEEEDPYFILFGGDVTGTYDGPTYEARWNRQYYSLSDSEDYLETVFVLDDGKGIATKSIPVMYFPPGSQVDNDGFLDVGTSYDEAELDLGGIYGFLSFSVDPTTGEPLDNLILFTEEPIEAASEDEDETDESDNNDEDEDEDEEEVVTFAVQEMPRSAMGSIAPIVWVEGFVDGEQYPEDAFVGGINGTVFAWDDDTDLFLSAIPDVDYEEFFGVDTTVVDMYAWDYDTLDENGDDQRDFYWFTVESGDAGGGRLQTTAGTGSESESAASGAANGGGGTYNDASTVFEANGGTPSAAASKNDNFLLLMQPRMMVCWSVLLSTAGVVFALTY